MATSTQSYDYIVVGGGSSGCVVAARLAEEKAGTVLLLEYGQSAVENPEILSADGFKEGFANDNTMWDRMSSKQGYAGNQSIYIGSGKGMGGGGSVNGMVYTRGDKLDFEQWPHGWQWEDVCPFYDALEQRLRVRHRTETKFTKTAVECSVAAGFQHKDGLNDGELSGFLGYNDMNFEGDNRRSSYVAFIRDQQKKLPLLTIKTECRVERIHFDENQIATKVEFSDEQSKYFVAANREVILCAGALETPKLLMLSGVGPESELNKFSIPVVCDSPGIGKNLQDHPGVSLFFKGNRPVDFSYPQLYGFTRVNYSTCLPEKQGDTCFVFLSVGSILKYTLKRIVPLKLLPGRLYGWLWLRKLLRKLVEGAFLFPQLNRFAGNVYGIVVILGKPLSRGEVRLASVDVADNAIVDPCYYREPADIDTMVAGVELANNIAQQAGFQAWGNSLLTKAAAASDKAKVARWIGKSTMTNFHYSGSCSMGIKPEHPVDLHLKVKGLKNVRVADASAVPVIPVSALNAPTMMLAYRAADFILRDIKACDSRA